MKDGLIEKVTIVGGTSWGTTLGILMARRGVNVSLLTRTEGEAQALEKDRENARFLPGASFPPALVVTANHDQALDKVDLLVLAVPAQSLRENFRKLAKALPKEALVLSAAKGLEIGTGKRMSEVINEELPYGDPDRIGVISGPNLAQEIAAGKPAASVIAARDLKVAERMREAVQAPGFRIYSQTDLVGVELGGALKNVIALGAGMVDGLDMGVNAKSVLITRGLMEMTRLGVSMGAHPFTFSGLTGLGDLMATCFSPLSRNRFLGQELVRGRTLEDIQSSMPHVAEGVPTTRAVRHLASSWKVEMPIAEQTYRILFEGLNCRQAAIDLMQREPKYEVVGLEGDWQRAPGSIV